MDTKGVVPLDAAVCCALANCHAYMLEAPR
jgi:hypothetical protein